MEKGEGGAIGHSEYTRVESTVYSQLRGACVKHQSDAMGGSRKWRRERVGL